MEKHLDERDELAGASLDPDNAPALGPVGQRLLVIGLVLGVIALIAVITWMLGYLAYTKPPIPGAG
ncbi:MAG TPA: hypothetical protein VF818_06650 [Ktedonobacterales bacterium]